MALNFRGGYRFPYSVAKELNVEKTGIPSKLVISIPDGFSVSVSQSERLCKDTVLATHEDGSVLTAGVLGSVFAISDTCITVIPDNEQETEATPIAERLAEISPGDIVEHMRKAGLFAEGGFPMWRMFSPLIGCGEMLMLNAAECEPGISCVHAMLRSYPEKILGGLKIMMRALALPKAVAIMTETMHYEAEILRHHLKHKSMLDILGVAQKYPLEHPKVMFSAVTGSHSAPSQQKAVMVTVRDCIAVYDLFVDGHIPSARVLTVEGKNYEIYIGTLLSELSDLCNLTVKERTIPHIGGLVSARTEALENASVSVDTKGVQYLTEHVFKNSDCIRCGKCSNYCPIGLYPMWIWEKLQKKKDPKVDDCIECGVCTAVCYSEIDICAAIRHYRKFGFISDGESIVEETKSKEEGVEYMKIGTITEGDGNEKEDE